MNERIRKLLTPKLEEWGGASGDNFSEELEKFAELIVKETMRVVANNLPQNTYLNVADAVIEHFKE